MVSQISSAFVDGPVSDGLWLGVGLTLIGLVARAVLPVRRWCQMDVCLRRPHSISIFRDKSADSKSKSVETGSPTQHAQSDMLDPQYDVTYMTLNPWQRFQVVILGKSVRKESIWEVCLLNWSEFRRFASLPASELVGQIGARASGLVGNTHLRPHSGLQSNRVASPPRLKFLIEKNRPKNAPKSESVGSAPLVNPDHVDPKSFSSLRKAARDLLESLQGKSLSPFRYYGFAVAFEDLRNTLNNLIAVSEENSTGASSEAREAVVSVIRACHGYFDALVDLLSRSKFFTDSEGPSHNELSKFVSLEKIRRVEAAAQLYVFSVDAATATVESALDLAEQVQRGLDSLHSELRTSWRAARPAVTLGAAAGFSSVWFLWNSSSVWLALLVVAPIGAGVSLLLQDLHRLLAAKVESMS